MNFSYANKNCRATLEKLETSALGLAEKEANRRLQKFGLNQTQIKKNGFGVLLLRQLKSPFFYLLFFAGVISLFVGEIMDSLVIISFVALNLIFGFFQEYRAEKASHLLEKYVPTKIKVLRSGRKILLDKKLLVPGDIVLLELGDLAPADLRLLEVKNFSVDESAFSGESVSVNKIREKIKNPVTEIFQAKNLVLAETAVISGSARGVVIATGQKTYFGEINLLTAQVQRESAYEKDLIQFSRVILKIVVATIAAIFILNFFVKGSENMLDFSIFCIALTVSILPEALPAIATFALSKGSINLARKHVVVKRLSSIEDLGNIEILCADKTGTLTENKLALEQVISPDQNKCEYFASLAASFIGQNFHSIASPFDKALWEEATQDQKNFFKRCRSLDEISFDHSRLRSLALLENEEREKFLVMRGAPEIVAKYCSKAEKDFSFKKSEQAFLAEAQKGNRVLAVAYRKVSSKKEKLVLEDEKNLILLGLLSFSDPLKNTAKDTIKKAKQLGVQIKILTGDCALAAGRIAEQSGLINSLEESISGLELSKLRGNKFIAACEKHTLFSRVSPDMKLKIIGALQKKAEVGFLGEGVNDAPALKLANVGIVVQESTDIARNVADIVLLRKDLHVVVEGIQEGRNIFANINKYIKCTLSANFGNFYSIAIISLFVDFVPMWPVQILLVNLLSDFPLVAVATDRVDAVELRKPKAYKLDKVVGLIISLACVNSLSDLFIFWMFRHSSIPLLQTVWFLEGILTEIILIYSIRSQFFVFSGLFHRLVNKTKKVTSNYPWPSRSLVWLSLLTTLITLVLPYTIWGKRAFHLASPNFYALTVILILVIFYFVISEMVKLVYFWKRENK